MENIIDKFVRTCTDGFLQGWHERNGGNLTYHLDKEECAEIKELIKEEGAQYTALPASFPTLAGEYFLTTGSGRYMRNVSLNREENIGLIKLDEKGEGFYTVWGLVGAKPTSELPSHLMNHAARLSVNPNCKVIYHAHPANITALSYTIEPDSKTLTRILWQSETECAVVFPEGVGYVPWMVPGGVDIAIESSRLIKKYPAILWAFHGVFCSGSTLDETFGLMHTIEKAAEIYLKAKSVGIKHTISDDNLRNLAQAFNITLNSEFLD